MPSLLVLTSFPCFHYKHFRGRATTHSCVGHHSKIVGGEWFQSFDDSIIASLRFKSPLTVVFFKVRGVDQMVHFEPAIEL